MLFAFDAGEAGKIFIQFACGNPIMKDERVVFYKNTTAIGIL